jgi:hypothetical protein
MLDIAEFEPLMREVEAMKVIVTPQKMEAQKGTGHKITAQMRADIIAYWKQTGSVARVIANHFCISQTTVSVILHKANLNKRTVTRSRV